MNFNLFGIFLILIFFTTKSVAQDDNVLLRYSRTSKQISELDWNLLQFNMLWHDSYGRGEYVISSPVSFDYDLMVFRTTLRIANKRYYDDPQPFLELNKVRQQAVLHEVIDYLLDILGDQFPDVIDLEESIDISFIYYESSDGSSVVANYKNGQLTLY